MADPKDPKDPKNEGFLRKVVRFVANPATDWADLNTRQAPDSTLEAERSELKLRRLIDETSLDDVPRAPKRVDVDPQQLIAELQPEAGCQVYRHRIRVVAVRGILAGRVAPRAAVDVRVVNLRDTGTCP